MGFLNKGNSKGKRLEVRESKIFLGIYKLLSKVGIYFVGRKTVEMR